MTTPLRVACPTLTDIPPAHQLGVWATDDRYVVLQFPPDAFTTDAKASVIARLGAALPEFRVFDSGRDWVTVMRVIPAESVVANAASFLAAMRLFRETATALAHRLADRLGVCPSDLLDRVTAHDNAVCDLNGEWSSRPHGMECRFENTMTGQEVEVCLTFSAEFGVLDPYFFARFVKTTPGLERLGALLRHDFHDAARVIDLLAAGGHLTMVEGPFGKGWVWHEPERLTAPSAPCQAPPGWWGES
ncbi:MAG TPA: hypothetical protein VD866_27410 [Urbifossiella sp.]|nr:hypothetical protein [Urbifossiella sp.]